MIVREMYLAVKTVLSQIYNDFFVKNEKNSEFLKNLSILVVAGAILYGGFYLYKFYVYRRESTAQKVLSECMNEFENARAGTGSWADVALAFDLGYQQNSGSGLAPYFLALRADALNQQGNRKKSIEVLESAIEKMLPINDFHGIYSVKLALMKLDSLDEATKKEGITLLKNESEKDSSGKMVALYYLGLYHWDKNEIEVAKSSWDKLVALSEKSEQKYDDKLPFKKSQYVKMAQEKLDQLS